MSVAQSMEADLWHARTPYNTPKGTGKIVRTQWLTVQFGTDEAVIVGVRTQLETDLHLFYSVMAKSIDC
jgi:hypothetical protein